MFKIIYNVLMKLMDENVVSNKPKEGLHQVYDGPLDGKWINNRGSKFTPEGSDSHYAYRLATDEYSYRRYYLWMTDEEYMKTVKIHPGNFED